MAESYDQRDLMFPRLTPAQIARLAPYGRRRSAAAGEVIFDQGEQRRGFFVLLAGRLEEAIRPSNKAPAFLRPWRFR